MCFGLTCKEFYAIHRDLNGKVGLSELGVLVASQSIALKGNPLIKKHYLVECVINDEFPKVDLAPLLLDWMGPEMQIELQLYPAVSTDQNKLHYVVNVIFVKKLNCKEQRAMLKESSRRQWPVVYRILTKHEAQLILA